MALAKVTHRIATDKDFAAQLLNDPQAALQAAGLDLPAEDLAIVLRVLRLLPHLDEEPLGYPWYNFQFSQQCTPLSLSTSE